MNKCSKCNGVFVVEDFKLMSCDVILANNSSPLDKKSPRFGWSGQIMKGHCRECDFQIPNPTDKNTL